MLAVGRDLYLTRGLLNSRNIHTVYRSKREVVLSSLRCFLREFLKYTTFKLIYISRKERAHRYTSNAGSKEVNIFFTVKFKGLLLCVFKQMHLLTGFNRSLLVECSYIYYIKQFSNLRHFYIKSFQFRRINEYANVFILICFFYFFQSLLKSLHFTRCCISYLLIGTCLAIIVRL